MERGSANVLIVASRIVSHPLTNCVALQHPGMMHSLVATTAVSDTPHVPNLIWRPPVAEGEGFEPPEAYASTVFKTAAFDHSATPP